MIFDSFVHPVQLIITCKAQFKKKLTSITIIIKTGHFTVHNKIPGFLVLLLDKMCYEKAGFFWGYLLKKICASINHCCRCVDIIICVLIVIYIMHRPVQLLYIIEKTCTLMLSYSYSYTTFCIKTVVPEEMSTLWWWRRQPFWLIWEWSKAWSYSVLGCLHWQQLRFYQKLKN